MASKGELERVITNKVRLCERSEPQSEPFVGQARFLYIRKYLFGSLLEETKDSEKSLVF